MSTNSDKISEIQRLVGVEADGLWGPNTRSAVASELGCQPTNASIQETVGATADGIIGSRTLTAILEKLRIKNPSPKSTRTDVFLDPGHTADYGREHPRQFKGVNWSKGKYKEIADALGFTSDTSDSIEHILNVKIAEATKKHLESEGKKVVLYDDPSLSNNAEIRQVYTRANACDPRVFVSIHNNAAGASGWEDLACKARGPVALYYPGRNKGKDLGQIIVNKLLALKGPDNRAEHIHTSTVGVLRNAKADMPAALIEVGFYDNLDNLHWMATNIDRIGKAICDGIIVYIG
jgi:N-acetylmuramoyl-L-alanine amidase